MRYTIRCYTVELDESIPSFKNSKQIAKRNGISFIMTDPVKQKKMDILTAKLSSLSYLEFSGSLTGDVETLTAALQPYLTVLCEQESSKMTAWTSFKDHLLRQLKENGILFKSSL